MGQFCLDPNGAIVDSMRYFEDDAGWRALALENKSRPLRFPCCNEPIYLSRSSAHVPYFSHFGGSACCASGAQDPGSRGTVSGETIGHWILKHLVAHLARDLGWSAQVEADCPPAPGEPALRANCLASLGDRHVAIEILGSRQSEVEILQRAELFHRRGIPCLWVTPHAGQPFLDPKAPFFLVLPRDGGLLNAAIGRCRRPVEPDGAPVDASPTGEGRRGDNRPDYAALGAALVARRPVSASGGVVAFGKSIALSDAMRLALENTEALRVEAERHVKAQEVARFAQQQAEARRRAAEAAEAAQNAADERAALIRRQADAAAGNPFVALSSTPRPALRTADSSDSSHLSWADEVRARCAADMRDAAKSVCPGRQDAYRAPWAESCAPGNYFVQVYASPGEDNLCVTRLSLHLPPPPLARSADPRNRPPATLVLETTFPVADGVGQADLLRWFEVFAWMTAEERYPLRRNTAQGERFAFGLLIRCAADPVLQGGEG